MNEQEANAFRQGFIEALEYAISTEWPDHYKMGAMIYIETVLKVSTTGEQENFFDAIRNAPDMTEEQKSYWLTMEIDQV